MKKSIVVLALSACIASAALPGFAQDTDTSSGKHALYLRAGSLFPSNTSTRTLGGSAQFSVGGSYDLVKEGDANNSSGIYLDYSNGSKNGGQVNTFGGGFEFRSFAAPANAGSHAVPPYFGVGVGYYHVKEKEQITAITTSSNGFGAKVFAGIGVTGSLFIEGSYRFLPNAGGISADGYSVEAGLRF